MGKLYEDKWYPASKLKTKKGRAVEMCVRPKIGLEGTC